MDEAAAVTDQPPVQDVYQVTEADGPYSIQIGYFSKRDNAEKLLAKAQANGLNEAFVRPEVRNGKNYYRVLVGHHQTAREAESRLASVEQYGFDVKVHKSAP